MEYWSHIFKTAHTKQTVIFIYFSLIFYFFLLWHKMHGIMCFSKYLNTFIIHALQAVKNSAFSAHYCMPNLFQKDWKQTDGKFHAFILKQKQSYQKITKSCHADRIQLKPTPIFNHMTIIHELSLRDKWASFHSYISSTHFTTNRRNPHHFTIRQLCVYIHTI